MSTSDRHASPTVAIGPHRPRPVSLVVSFIYVRNRSAHTTQDGQARSRTVMAYSEPGLTDLESEWGSSRSRPARERPSDKVSDNRHGQRWTPVDTHGRSVPGQGCCGAGSPRLYLASGRRGQRQQVERRRRAGMSDGEPALWSVSRRLLSAGSPPLCVRGGNYLDAGWLRRGLLLVTGVLSHTWGVGLAGW